MEEHLSKKLGLPLIKPNQSHKKLLSATHLPNESFSKEQSLSILRARIQSFKVV